MTMASVAATTTVPKCFGQEWSKDEPECAGGPDPHYTGPEGTKVRDQCNFFEQCGARFAASRTGVIPVQSLFAKQPMVLASGAPAVSPPQPMPIGARPPVVTPVPLTMQQVVQQANSPTASFIEQQRQAAFSIANQRPPAQVIPVQSGNQPAPVAGLPPQLNIPLPQAVQPGTYPASLYQLNYVMPGYLSVPEIRHPGESIWTVLLREVFRATFKAMGHQLSHFFDTQVFRRPGQ